MSKITYYTVTRFSGMVDVCSSPDDSPHHEYVLSSHMNQEAADRELKRVLVMQQTNREDNECRIAIDAYDSSDRSDFHKDILVETLRGIFKRSGA